MDQERTLSLNETKELMDSLNSANQQWMFNHVKHFDEVFTADDELLNALDTASNAILAPTEDDNLFTEIDVLSSQYFNLSMTNDRLADVQLRLFTAQVSHAYLTSLAQPHTPSRTPPNQRPNSTSDLNSLRGELETLVSSYEEATKLITKQTIANRVSETLIRRRVEKLEGELDGVQQIEAALEGMVGRTAVARELLAYEMSKITTLQELLRQAGEWCRESSSETIYQRTKPEYKEFSPPDEVKLLQSMLGVRNRDDVEKIMDKKRRLERDLLDASLTQIKQSTNDTYLLFTPI